MDLRKISVLVASVTCWSNQSMGEKPNFVFILADDLGWADVACNFPGTFYETPNMDRLAQKGIRFTDSYASCPVCSPTRASIMTGKYPVNVNITDWIPGDDPKDRPLLGPADRNELALEEVTFPELLKKAGYKTALIGKWHLGGEGFLPENQGFDINIGGYDIGSPPGGYYSPYKNPKMKDGPEGEYLTDRQTTEGIRFIENNHDRPFLLYLSYYTVHMPIQASRKHIAHFREKSKNLKLQVLTEKEEGEGKTRTIQSNPDYASMVTAMDENVGRVMETLEKSGLDKNTWIIFTSDNGGLSTLRRGNAPTANGNLRAGKGWCYEGGTRVPLVISGPGIKNRGMKTDVPVISMDFFPTLLSLAGIKTPICDGQNLVPLLTERKKLKREYLFWHYPHYHGSGWTPGSAVRNGDWKLIVRYEDNRTELYNLRSDPSESTDVSTKFPQIVSQLQKPLMKWLQSTGAKMPLKNTK
jgi:arylsulfatase A-like enzyme